MSIVQADLLDMMIEKFHVLIYVVLRNFLSKRARPRLATLRCRRWKFQKIFSLSDFIISHKIKSLITQPSHSERFAKFFLNLYRHFCNRISFGPVENTLLFFFLLSVYDQGIFKCQAIEGTTTVGLYNRVCRRADFFHEWREKTAFFVELNGAFYKLLFL